MIIRQLKFITRLFAMFCIFWPIPIFVLPKDLTLYYIDFIMFVFYGSIRNTVELHMSPEIWAHFTLPSGLVSLFVPEILFFFVEVFDDKI